MHLNGMFILCVNIMHNLRLGIVQLYRILGSVGNLAFLAACPGQPELLVIKSQGSEIIF